VIWIDWVALAIVVIAAAGGAARGLVWSVFSFGGFVVGAIVGGHFIAPHVLARSSESPYAPLIAFGSALVCAFVLEAIGGAAGSVLGARLHASPLRGLDTAGGLVLGAVWGLAMVWILGSVGLQLPGQTELRRDLQQSVVVREVNSIVPPRTLLNFLARVDPLPTIVGPPLPSEPPTQGVLRDPGVATASRSVVKILGTACGLGLEGSGWVAGPGLVVTNAHVVAGEQDTTVVSQSGGALTARAVVFDPHNDVAVLRVAGLTGSPLRLAEPRTGAAVAILGFPLNGGLDAEPGRIGTTARVLTQDAYGRPTFRTVTSFRGRVRPGNSGGPAVDSSGAVKIVVFAGRTTGGGGFGIPSSIVRDALVHADGPVSTGPCVR
jgi:S1-C subfamily serine protease